MCRRAGARVGDDKARDGQAANRAFYAAVGVGLEGDGDVLGIWVPPAAEGARHCVFCQIFVGRFGVSFSPFERLFLGRFGFGQSCGLSVIA